EGLTRWSDPPDIATSQLRMEHRPTRGFQGSPEPAVGGCLDRSCSPGLAGLSRSWSGRQRVIETSRNALFDLPQVMGNGVSRALQPYGSVHQPADVAIEGGRVLAHQEQAPVDALLARVAEAVRIRGRAGSHM